MGTRVQELKKTDLLNAILDINPTYDEFVFHVLTEKGRPKGKGGLLLALANIRLSRVGPATGTVAKAETTRKGKK